MSPDEIKLILHSRLGSEEHPELGWSPRFLDAGDRGRAEDLRCLEVRVEGLGTNDELFADATLTLTEIAGRLCGATAFEAYLVLVEDRLLPTSRIRSHKGLFQRRGQIKQGDHIEWEVESDEGWSFFIGMAPVTASNRDECLSLACHFNRAFILLSTQPADGVYGRDFLESVVPCLSIKETIWVSYMKLIPRVCVDGMAVLSTGFHDPRGEFANLRLFFQQGMERLMLEAVKAPPAGPRGAVEGSGANRM